MIELKIKETIYKYIFLKINLIYIHYNECFDEYKEWEIINAVRNIIIANSLKKISGGM